MEKNLIGTKKIAEKLNVPRSWIYSKTRTNEIPHYKVGKYRKFNESEVLDWLKKQK
jgi:excisionase family DNA binding protein